MSRPIDHEPPSSATTTGPEPAAPVPTRMRAIRLTRYGSPDALELAEIDTPMPGPDELLIRVEAVSVNPVDWHRMRGEPWIVHASDGWRRPKDPRLGADVAGTVAAVGVNVTDLRPGDAVFGMSVGTFAEYVRVSRGAIVPRPANVTIEEAAAVPVAAITALQGLRDVGRVQAGQHVLVNGASGGVGSFAVQIAKALGANVTGVTSTSNVDLVRSIGADEVIDYTRDDFSRRGKRFDVVFDAVGNRSIGDCRRALAAGGALVLCGAGSHKKIGPIGRLVQGVVLTRLGSQTIRMYLAHRTQPDLLRLKELLETGAIRPVIDRRYPFEEIREAIRYQEAGHARGKVVVTI